MAEEKSPSAKASEDKKEAKEEKKSASTDASQGGDVKVPEKFKKLVDEVEKMSVLDLSELVSILEDKFGVSAAAPMAIAAAPGAVGEESVAEEKSEFDIELTAAGDQKINAIKAV
ncbi:MAG TPA: hypothetical protein ENG89_00230, partial [Candidatus Moranbacteria bacterium]|nr:hypothetical protein [Candidatus Moranbacteria bacterium]